MRLLLSAAFDTNPNGTLPPPPKQNQNRKTNSIHVSLSFLGVFLGKPPKITMLFFGGGFSWGKPPPPPPKKKKKTAPWETKPKPRGSRAPGTSRRAGTTRPAGRWVSCCWWGAAGGPAARPRGRGKGGGGKRGEGGSQGPVWMDEARGTRVSKRGAWLTWFGDVSLRLSQKTRAELQKRWNR